MKAVKPTGEVLIWEVAKKGVQSWVAEQFKLRGANGDAEACRALIVLVGDDPYELATEIDKLATWAAGERVTAATVEELVAPRAEGSNFALTDACGARDVPGMLLAAEQLLERTPDPRSRTIPRVASGSSRATSRASARARRSRPRASRPRTRRPAQAAPVLRPEALRPGAELHLRRAARGDRAPRRARPRAQGRLTSLGRARARADADRDRSAARARSLLRLSRGGPSSARRATAAVSGPQPSAPLRAGRHAGSCRSPRRVEAARRDSIHR